MIKKTSFIALLLAVLLSACGAPVTNNYYYEGSAPAEAAQQPAPASGESHAAENEGSGLQYVETTGALMSVDVPNAVVPWKKNPDGCAPFPDEVCNVLDLEGVLGVDNYAELYNPDGSKKNNSGEWLGSKNHYIGYTPEVGLLCPEGSYCSAYAAGFHIVGGGYDLRFNGCEKCSWGFIARSPNAEDGVDRNVALVVSDYGALGAITLTRFAIEPRWAQYFSLGYADAQGVNALNFDNCGIGDEDCEVFYLAVMDYNDGALTVLQFDGRVWTVVWTNVIL